MARTQNPKKNDEVKHVGLPRFEHPSFTTYVPVIDLEIEFRPFLVKEQKALLIASESKNQKNILRTMKGVMQSCILSDDVNVSKLPMFAVEWLLLQLKINSVGDISTIEIVPQKCKCGVGVECDLNLAELELVVPDEHKKKIEFENGYILNMRYPTVETTEKYSEDMSYDERLELVASCIETIESPGGEIFSYQEFKLKEFQEFIENLDQTQFQNVFDFVSSMPHLEKDIDIVCPKCKNQETVKLQGISDFLE